MEYGARLYAPIIYLLVTGYGGPRVVKDHHYGVHPSSLTVMMDSVLSLRYWLNRAPTSTKTPVTAYPVVGCYKIHHRYIWIVMGGINTWPILPPCIDIIPSRPK